METFSFDPRCECQHGKRDSFAVLEFCSSLSFLGSRNTASAIAGTWDLAKMDYFFSFFFFSFR